MPPLSSLPGRFLNELGWPSIHATGRNAYLIILSRALRMFAHGAVTLILAPFLSSLSISDASIGLFMTLTLFGDVVLGMYLTLIADRFGRRKVLLLGSAMMMTTGIVFALSTSYWLLLAAAIFGVVSATGTDFGPFRSVEESMIAELTTPATMADVLTWYITLSGMGSALGSEVCGQLVQYLVDNLGVSEAYRAVFWIYTGNGVVNAVLASCLSEDCEMKKYEHVAQDEEEEDLGQEMVEAAAPVHSTPPKKRSRWSNSLSSISAPTRAIMLKLWLLLAVDAFADGMAAPALTVYYLSQTFQPSPSVLGNITSAANILSAASSIFAGSLARRFGLVWAMVFPHAISSAAILLFPLPRNLVVTTLFLLLRTGLQMLDQAPRGTFIARYSQPDERTAVLGVAGMVRTIAAMPGPWITGVLAGKERFRWAFVAAGTIRLMYDVSLYVAFAGFEAGNVKSRAMSMSTSQA